jgi:hypothetical protein
MSNQAPLPKPANAEQEGGKGLDETACSAEKILAEVMQDIWNDRAMDCGEIPSCFEIKGPPTTRIYADFEDSTFVWNIVETLRARGYSILPNRELSQPDL